MDCWRGFTPIPLPSQSSNDLDKAQLESIELGGYTSRSVMGSFLHPQSLLGISRLREISIKSETWGMLDTVLSVNQHIAQNIESFMWLDARLRPYINLLVPQPNFVILPDISYLQTPLGNS
jgi:hypothetical protein